MIDFEGADSRWVERAQAASEVLSREAGAGDAAAALTSRAIDAVWESGALRMTLPRQFGGDEVDAVTAMRVFEELARGDASAAWATMAAGCTTAWLASALTDEGAEEVFGGSQAGIVAGMPWPVGKATRVDGGYEFEGRFQFASGAAFANWFVGGALVEGPETSDGQAKMIVAVFEKSEVERAGNWDVLGMRATESIDIVIPATFVPLRRTTSPPSPSSDGNLAWARSTAASRS